jgi:tripartite-type tricarboxylate transporter receptor subunit TctC
MTRFYFIVFSLLFAAVSAQAQAQAQTWPARPVRLVIPYSPGGAVDVLGRGLADKLSQQWGQSVFVENRPGSATIAAAELVARAPADGHTLLLTISGTVSINPHLFNKLPYDSDKDFIPVTMLAVMPQVLTAASGFKPNTLPELIALARARPGTINYGSPGIGTQGHLGMEMLKAKAGINLVHVPYKGGPQAVIAAMADEVQLVITTIPSAQTNIKSGRLKAIAIDGAKRSARMPDVPTFTELGYPDVTTYVAFGLFVPAGTPREVVTRLHRDATRIVSEPEFREKHIDANGYELSANSPEQFVAYLRRESELYAQAIKTSGAKID